MSERRLSALPAALLAAVFVVVPLALVAADSSYLFRLAVVTLIFTILALSMQLIAGVAGPLSLSYVAIYRVGAYTAAILSTRLGVDAALTIPSQASSRAWSASRSRCRRCGSSRSTSRSRPLASAR